ncbi:MAG TPA: GAF domain-containing protein [Burkholderiaceae bacterium]|nr:GAF domain-containing protein [Burkholderiaceae bacterium]
MVQQQPHDDLKATVSQMLTARARRDGALFDGSVEEVLHRLREEFGLDVVFVSEFIDGQRMFRFVDRSDDSPAIEAGDFGELEASFCQRVVDGRIPQFIADVSRLGPEVDLPVLPMRIGTHLGVPVVMGDGSTFGTLCGFSTVPSSKVRERDMPLLRECAELVARKLDLARSLGLHEPPPSWSSRRGARYHSDVWKLRGAWALNEVGRHAFLES